MKLLLGVLIVVCSFVLFFSIGSVHAQEGDGGGAAGGGGTAAGGVAGDPDCDPKVDIMLNTNVPFVGRCIKRSTDGDASSTTIVSVFPKLVGAMARITMTAVIIIGFLGILLGGFLIASAGAFNQKALGVKIIVSVIAGLILLGASAIILNLINPEFFGTASGA